MDLYPQGSKRWGKAVIMMGEAVGATWFAPTWSSALNSCSTWLNFQAFLNKTPLEDLKNAEWWGAEESPEAGASIPFMQEITFGVFSNLMVNRRNKSNWHSRWCSLCYSATIKYSFMESVFDSSRLHSPVWNQPEPVIQLEPRGQHTEVLILPVSEKSRWLSSLCHLIHSRTEKKSGGCLLPLRQVSHHPPQHFFF